MQLKHNTKYKARNGDKILIRALPKPTGKQAFYARINGQFRTYTTEGKLYGFIGDSLDIVAEWEEPFIPPQLSIPLNFWEENLYNGTMYEEIFSKKDNTIGDSSDGRSCAHKWEDYLGLNESFTHCSKCGKKED